ncbi:MAG: hypothetical protein JO103_13965, partial [Candidatus Eremiobacteraeota bacterium]|nr:hypothetical protein [Candidatus Eremiobacteraeota bacterium]
MRGRRAVLIAASAAILLVVALVAGHDAVAAFGLRTVAGVLGYDLAAQRVQLSSSSLAVVGLSVTNRAGEPVLTADRLDVAFSPRDLLPGGKRRFGLRAVDLQHPRLTLIHHADGTYNVAIPANGPPPRPDNTPLDLRVRVRDGEVALLDRFVVPNHERRESLGAVAVDAVLAPRDPAYYRVDAVLHDGARSYPIRGRARFDHHRGFADQHWHADELPIGALVNFAIATHAAHIADGRLRNVDARIYGFIQPDGTTDTHIGGTADLVDGKIFAAQLRAPLGDAHGTLRIYDDGLSTDGIDATIANTPVHLTGGVYNLAAPHLRLAVAGAGPLDRLRTIADASARRPLAGDLRYRLLVDGPITAPVVRATFTAPRIAYGAYALHDAAGTMAFSGERFEVISAGAGYGPLTLRGSGTLNLGTQVDTDLVVAVTGPGDALPYATAVLPHASVRALVHLTGTGEKLSADGTIAAATPRARGALDGAFDFTPDGIGTIGPVALTRADGASLYARATFDRPNGLVDGIVTVHRLSLLRGSRDVTQLAGLNTLPLPNLAGTIDADLVGEVQGAAVTAAAGALHVRHAGAAGIALGDADAQVGANADGVAISDLSLRGPLGDLHGDGSYATGTQLFALRGQLRSSFERLAPLLRGVRARGAIDAGLRVAASNGRTVVQIADARFQGARIQGVPLRGAGATVALRGNAIDVVAARADVAGGSVVAHGSFGNGGTVRVSASGIDAAAFRGAGLPLGTGRLAGVATVGGTQRDPRAQAGVALSDARLANAPLAGVVAGSYAGGRIALDRADVAYDSMVATASGTIANVLAHPRLDIAAQVRGADVGTLASTAGITLPYPDAALDADVRVRGAATAPAVAGDARIAAGSLNGLAFHDLDVPLGGTISALAVNGGHVTVGSTTLHFDGAFARGSARGALRSDRVDLADFNDYFDGAETLAGQGRLAASFAVGPNTFTTAGNVALADTRYRRLPLGDVAAHWSSHDRTIAAATTVGGVHGRLAAAGTMTLPAAAPIAHGMAFREPAPLAGAAVDAHATLAGLDLTTWLPAVGIVAPVTGHVDADVRVRGAMPQPAFAGTASLHQATVGRMPIDNVDLAARGAGGRFTVTRGHLDAPGLVADANGTFGLGTHDPLDLTLRAHSPDAAALYNRATGAALDASGALDTTLSVSGTRAAPVVHDVLDLDNPRFRQMNARHTHVDVAYGNRRLTLRQVAVDLIAGRVEANAVIPATLTPPFIDTRDAPLTAHLVAQGVDLGQFAPLLPKNTKLGGIVNGDVAVAGTTANPALGGALQLAKGSFVNPEVASEIHNGTMQIAFAGHDARLTTLHADVGGGAVDGDGSVRFGDLRSGFNAVAFDLTTREKNVGLDIPKLFRGKLDGTLALRRTAGAPVLVAGDLAFAHARIPLTALLLAKGGSSNAPPPPVAFDLHVAATTDDRLQGPAVDVGATGGVGITGTLANPVLDGAFASTDGTLSL